MNKIAISTQTYRADFEECKLLCKSIDAFVPSYIPHYIFVNDEDYDFFKKSNFFKDRKIYKKSDLLPRYLIGIHKKILGHQYYFSPITIPVREWIIQQICKLSVFDIIDRDIDAVINIDSEVVFLKPFNVNLFSKDNKYLLFKELFNEEPNHFDYCKIGKKILNLSQEQNTIDKYCYQSASVVFVRENLLQLHNQIRNYSFFKSWKLKLCNTYRFSEYYLYGLFNDYIYNDKNHFITNQRPFPMIDLSNSTPQSFKNDIIKIKENSKVQGVWLQKHQRNNKNMHLLSFENIEKIINQCIFNTI